MEHIHNKEKNIHSANNRIVCDECITPEDKQGNECYCSCHTALKDQCPKCVRFHRV